MAAPWIDRARDRGARLLGVLLPLFVLSEVNYPRLDPQSQLVVFATLGLMLVFLRADREVGASRWARLGSLAVVLGSIATLIVGVFLVVQTESALAERWISGQSLGDRAGAEAPIDIVIGMIGLGLVLWGAYRSVGLALPVLSITFLAYGLLGSSLPDWLLPHRGYDLPRLVSQTFLHSQGVFGVALSVMFTYVFLFVVFGALLEATGATEYIISASRRAFSNSAGGPGKVAVISSGLMGSLSGSAVANTASTGTFTIPMMKSAGLPARVAGGLEAAASSGGALVPPVMGAGAYMMLEIIDPPVTYLEVVRAALIPAILYYLSLFLIVHFFGQRTRADSVADGEGPKGVLVRWEGAVFVGGLGVLVAFLLMGFTVFRSVSLAALVVLGLGMAHPRTRLGLGDVIGALRSAAQSGTPLISAAACVGIIIGVVTLTGAGTRLPAIVLPLAQENLMLALLVIMGSSLVLGMGLPSAVCYLLMATLIGPVLGNLGVVPLAAHLFIFYFGMMSMVTPPVALAGYAASSIAGSKLLETGVSAFKFALVGFTLPFMFVFRPQLLMLSPTGGLAPWQEIAVSTLLVAAGVLAFAVAIAGYARGRLRVFGRAAFLLAAGLLFYPGGTPIAATMTMPQAVGATLLALLGVWRLRYAARA